ncbi:MAG: outer membrane beta-barrel protein [Desulfobaccales bacterium]
MGTKVGAALAIILALWTPNLAAAADWSVVPTITQRSEFNSNLNFTSTNKISDYIFSLQPAADFNYTTEISQLQGHVGLNGMHYITQSELDHIDQNYQINGRYQVLDRVNLSLTSFYINDTTLQQELMTSGLVMSRSQRQSFGLGPGVTYNLTERLLATASYSFNRVLYAAPQYTDYTNHQVGLNFTYLLKNEKTTLISNNIVRESLYAGGNDSKTIGIYFGATHKLTERWDVSAMSGANISFYSFNTQVLDLSQFPFFIRLKTQQVNSSGVTPYINLSTRYQWTNKLNVSAAFSVDQSPSAYGAIYEVDQFSLSCAYNFTERLSGSLSGGYSLSNQSSQNVSSEYNYYNLSPTLTYQITENLSVSPGYNFQNGASLTAGGTSAHVHSAWLQFTYAYPIHYQR